ncbi:hypothetical protein CcaverHIS631_0604270 [Cutaneotrichosporon cavernicola]|nr:hypothetical protein CcaverHIS631_0604270 [Cutaneotrichosporon cavernicola]
MGRFAALANELCHMRVAVVCDEADKYSTGTEEGHLCAGSTSRTVVTDASPAPSGVPTCKKSQNKVPPLQIPCNIPASPSRGNSITTPEDNKVTEGTAGFLDGMALEDGQKWTVIRKPRTTLFKTHQNV